MLYVVLLVEMVPAKCTSMYISQICVWKTMKKWPMITVSNAHDGAGDECWISALRALRNTDLIASGLYSPLFRLIASRLYPPPTTTKTDFVRQHNGMGMAAVDTVHINYIFQVSSLKLTSNF